MTQNIQLSNRLAALDCTATFRTCEHGLHWLEVRQQDEEDGMTFLVYCAEVESIEEAQDLAPTLREWDLEEIID
jgi:hypothetical protein